MGFTLTSNRGVVLLQVSNTAIFSLNKTCTGDIQRTDIVFSCQGDGL